jgi:hypothetical protein
MMGRESLCMARQLFNAEQLGPQGRFARAGAQTLISGLAALKAQWQSLHVLLTFDPDSCNQTHRRNSSCLATPGSPVGLGVRRIMPNSSAGRLIKPNEKTLPR